jgi:hypothetical protein
MPARTRIPKYRLHTGSGQALVVLNSRRHYLGAHGTPESKQRDERLVAEWLMNGRQSPILEYGLANSTPKRRIKGLQHRDTRVFTPASLKTDMGRKWNAKAYGADKIRAKTLTIDPWSDDPAVLTRSANFSKGSCHDNDENTMLTRGDRKLVVIEFLRMYDHYKIRYWINEMERRGNRAPMFLHEDRSDWLDIYYRRSNRSRKFRDRVVFAGGD